MGNARTKLNVAYFNGCLVVAAVIGVALESWIVFLATLAVTIGYGVYGGDIRPKPVRR
jgi:hypothetical protein